MKSADRIKGPGCGSTCTGMREPIVRGARGLSALSLARHATPWGGRALFLRLFPVMSLHDMRAEKDYLCMRLKSRQERGFHQDQFSSCGPLRQTGPIRGLLWKRPRRVSRPSRETRTTTVVARATKSVSGRGAMGAKISSSLHKRRDSRPIRS